MGVNDPASVTPNGEVHPAAAVFPMLGDEEMDDLVAHVTEHGLLHPIVLLPDGTLLDGRNRLAACQRAGVEPLFEVHDGDPVAYVIAANVARRHMTKGQSAMAVAKVVAAATRNVSLREAAKTSGVNRERVRRAAAVLDHARELADAVLAGKVPLDAAYAALDRSGRKAERATAGTRPDDVVDLVQWRREREGAAPRNEAEPDCECLADIVRLHDRVERVYYSWVKRQESLGLREQPVEVLNAISGGIDRTITRLQMLHELVIDNASTIADSLEIRGGHLGLPLGDVSGPRPEGSEPS